MTTAEDYGKVVPTVLTAPPITTTLIGTRMASSLWNGPICPVCRSGYLGSCTVDHRPYIATGYVGRHR